MVCGTTLRQGMSRHYIIPDMYDTQGYPNRTLCTENSTMRDLLFSPLVTNLRLPRGLLSIYTNIFFTQ